MDTCGANYRPWLLAAFAAGYLYAAATRTRGARRVIVQQGGTMGSARQFRKTRDGFQLMRVTVLDRAVDVAAVIATWEKRGWTFNRFKRVEGSTPPSVHVHLRKEVEK